MSSLENELRRFEAEVSRLSEDEYLARADDLIQSLNDLFINVKEWRRSKDEQMQEMINTAAEMNPNDPYNEGVNFLWYHIQEQRENRENLIQSMIDVLANTTPANQNQNQNHP